jgi:hypothetical protein
VKIAIVVLALAGALLVQTTLSGLFVGVTLAVNLALVAVGVRWRWFTGRSAGCLLE